MEDIARMVKAITAMHSELEPTTETKYEFARDLTK
jgi:hypothetical protein